MFLSVQNIEHVLEEDLFPVSLSIEERIRHWIFLFSHSESAHKNGIFTPAHEKALTAVLCQKRRLQSGIQNYLDIQTKAKVLKCLFYAAILNSIASHIYQKVKFNSFFSITLFLFSVCSV